jgi:predicted nuclease with TOPRIM domain
MKDTLEQRLNTLKSEHETGQKMLAELDAKRAQLTTTLLRIEGAMQVLQELLAQEQQPADNVTDLPKAAR